MFSHGISIEKQHQNNLTSLEKMQQVDDYSLEKRVSVSIIH